MECSAIGTATARLDDDSPSVTICRGARDFLVAPRDVSVAHEILNLPFLRRDNDYSAAVDCIGHRRHEPLRALILTISLRHIGKRSVEHDRDVGSRVGKSCLQKISGSHIDDQLTVAEAAPHELVARFSAAGPSCNTAGYPLRQTRDVRRLRECGQLGRCVIDGAKRPGESLLNYLEGEACRPKANRLVQVLE